MNLSAYKKYCMIINIAMLITWYPIISTTKNQILTYPIYKSIISYIVYKVQYYAFTKIQVFSNFSFALLTSFWNLKKNYMYMYCLHLKFKFIKIYILHPIPWIWMTQFSKATTSIISHISYTCNTNSCSLYPVFTVVIQNINIDGIPLQNLFLEILARYIHLEVVLTL